MPALEDEAFAAGWRATGSRSCDPPTSGCGPRRGPTGARARGLSVDLAVSTLAEQRRYRAEDFTLERLRAAKGRRR